MSFRSKGSKKGIKRSRPVHDWVARGARGIGYAAGDLLARGGSRAADAFERITGYGDYTIHSNSLVGGNSPGIFAGPRSVIVRHREYLGDVSGSTSFDADGYILNPGNRVTFPWLSEIAGNFEQYRFRGLVFEYKSMSAAALNSTNTALGSVMMATQYNSQAAAFTEKSQVANHEFSSSSAPCSSSMHPVECDMKQSPIDILYVDSSSGTTPRNDSLLYDLGRFYFCTDGMQAVSTIGELWISYEVEFLKPKLAPEHAQNMTRAAYSISNSVTWTIATGFAQAVLVNDDIGLDIAADTISFPVESDRRYLMVYTLTTASGAQSYPGSPIAVANGTHVGSYAGSATGVTGTQFVQYSLVDSDSGDNTAMVLTLPGAAAHATGAWSGTIMILEVPSSYAWF